jgi:hypothetical protein
MGKEGNRAYLRFAEPVRRVITRLPHGVLVGISHIGGLALDAYIGLYRFVRLPMRPADGAVVETQVLSLSY